MKRKIGYIAAVIVALWFMGTIMCLPPDVQELKTLVVPPQPATYIPIPTNTPTPTPTAQQVFYKEFIDTVENGEMVTVTIEYTYIGTYFITAYSPSECGFNGENYPVGWRTASDTICHRADHNHRLTEPTTCAIDRNYHSFGDLFYIEEFDRVFVAEDTGSGVKGHHLDLFYEEYDDVLSFPTGYYTVYSVEYVTKTVKAREE